MARARPCRVGRQGARHALPPCALVAGLVALVAWREEITTAGALPRSLSGAGCGRSPRSCPCRVCKDEGLNTPDPQWSARAGGR